MTSPTIRETIARTLYACEAARSAQATRVAQRINPLARNHMEPFEDCADVWYGDAEAVLAALPSSHEEVERLWGALSGADDVLNGSLRDGGGIEPADRIQHARAIIKSALLPAGGGGDQRNQEHMVSREPSTSTEKARAEDGHADPHCPTCGAGAETVHACTCAAPVASDAAGQQRPGAER